MKECKFAIHIQQWSRKNKSLYLFLSSEWNTMCCPVKASLYSSLKILNINNSLLAVMLLGEKKKKETHMKIGCTRKPLRFQELFSFHQTVIYIFHTSSCNDKIKRRKEWPASPKPAQNTVGLSPIHQSRNKCYGLTVFESILTFPLHSYLLIYFLQLNCKHPNEFIQYFLWYFQGLFSLEKRRPWWTSVWPSST